MTPTSIRHFEIPELTELIVSHLTSRDITDLMQTSRQLHAVMEPWFYHNLVTVHRAWKIGLWQSPDGLKALARNFHHARSWETDLYYLVNIFHATTPTSASVAPTLPSMKQEQEPLQLQEKEQEGNDSSTSVTQPPPASSSSPMTTTLTITKTTATTATPQLSSSTNMYANVPVSLPPITRITKLDISLVSSVDKMRSYSDFDVWSRYTVIDYLCATLRRIPQLRELRLRQLSIKDARSARTLVLALRKLTSLTHLQVSLSQSRVYSQFESLLVFSCPPSIKSLDICSEEQSTYPATGDRNEALFIATAIKQIAIITDKVRARGATTPLIHLRDLRLWSAPKTTATAITEELYANLGHCPNVESLRLKLQVVPDNLDGTRIARMCPKIRNLVYLCPAAKHTSEKWPYKLLLALPEHQLEMLRHYGTDTGLDGDLVGRALVRHCHSLRAIFIRNQIPSETVGMILQHCGALEVLNILYSPMQLEDAIAVPWASSRIMELSIDINTGIRRESFYLRPPPVHRSANEEQLFDRLEILYRQIGKQTSLRSLQLGAFHDGDLKARTTGKYIQPFPGLLRLSDKTENGIVPGYLELLSGLKRLQEIQGSVAPETADHKLAEDAAEVDWILNHWPEFRIGAFFPQHRLPV
ncbi:hypothetical protein BGZ47_003630 [Haplosporangium gracile]|nr:hypothetical protein BGZ47_003630 [Haplosporangium gracile]